MLGIFRSRLRKRSMEGKGAAEAQESTETKKTACPPMLETLPVEILRCIIEFMVLDENLMSFYALIEKRLVCKSFDHEICRSIALNFEYRHARHASDYLTLKLVAQLCEEPNAKNRKAISGILLASEKLQNICPEEWAGRHDDIVKALSRQLVWRQSTSRLGYQDEQNPLKCAATPEWLQEQETYLGSAAVAACYYGSISSVRTLLAAGVDINLNDDLFGGLLAAASCGGQLDMIKYLLTLAPDDFFIGDAADDTAFFQRTKIFRTLAEWDAGRTPSKRGLPKSTGTVTCAAEVGNSEIFHHIVNIMSPDTVYAIRYDLMEVACIQGNEEVIRFVLNHNPQNRDNHIRDLLDQWASHNIYREEDSRSIYAIELAARSGNEKLVEYLLSVGGRFSGRQVWDERWRPDSLILAVRHGHGHIVEVLLTEAGEDGEKNLYPPKKLGHALREAAELGYLDIVKILITNGASIEGRDGVWALERATIGGYDEVIEFLLEKLVKKLAPSSLTGMGSKRLKGAVQECKSLGARLTLQGYGLQDYVDEDFDESCYSSHRRYKQPPKTIIRLKPTISTGFKTWCHCGVKSAHPSPRSFAINLIDPEGAGFGALVQHRSGV